MRRNSLSFEFYQFIVGDPSMTLHGWKQLAWWSIEHSCLSAEQKDTAMDILNKDFEKFCDRVVEEYSGYVAAQIALMKAAEAANDAALHAS